MIGEYWRGDISLRELRVLVENLPPDSALARRELGHAWTSDRDWLTADIRDGIYALATMFANVNREQGRPAIPPPEPTPRPGGQDREAAAAKREAAERAAHDRTREALGIPRSIPIPIPKR